MSALNHKAPSFVPAHLQPQVCEYKEEYETREDENGDCDYEHNDEDDCYVDSDNQLVLMDNVGEWFRLEGVEDRYYHVFEGKMDDNNGHFYPRPIRRSLTWVNSRK